MSDAPRFLEARYWVPAVASVAAVGALLRRRGARRVAVAVEPLFDRLGAFPRAPVEDEEGYLMRTEAALDSLLPPETDGRVAEAMRYATLSGGKRLRAFLATQRRRPVDQWTYKGGQPMYMEALCPSMQKGWNTPNFCEIPIPSFRMLQDDC